MSDRRAATRERLMDAVLRLVAERGYDAASVGAIEREAGLAPRSGALYQHFDDKEALLRAAIERELEAVDELPQLLELLPLGSLAAELTLLARWNLASLERRATLSAVVRREAARLPADLRDELFRRLVAEPYAAVVAWLEGRFAATGAPPPDLPAVALILVESMSAVRSMRLTFGRVADDVDDDRFVAAWVDVALAVAARHGLRDRPGGDAPAR